MMVKYFRLLRLQDQHLQFGCALAAGVYMGGHVSYVFWWAMATTLISFAAFITNEMTDREDTDKYSWNKVHLKKDDKPNPVVVTALWLVCVLMGLLISFRLGVLGWGLLMTVIGTLYSLSPIRFKGRVGLDILAQMAVWWWIPFVVPVLHFFPGTDSFWIFVAVMSGLIWGFFYPYQLSDFSADEKAGLASTHLRLGMNKSLLFGTTLLVAGELGYWGRGLWKDQGWSLIFAFISLVSLIYYWRWLRLGSRIEQEEAMQRYVAIMKPVSWLLVPYIIWWLVR